MADVTPSEPPVVPASVPQTLRGRFVWAFTPLFLTVVGLALAAVVGAVTALYWTGYVAYGRAAKARDRVRVGMSVVEVKQAVDGLAEVTYQSPSALPEEVWLRSYSGMATYKVVVHFDGAGRVTATDPPEYEDD